MIDFTPSEQQLAMKEAARKFAQSELKPLVKEAVTSVEARHCRSGARDNRR